MFYVYELRDPRDNTVFHAAMGRGDQAFQHQRQVVNGTAQPGSRAARIQSIVDSGNQVEVAILAEYAFEEDAIDHEFHLVERLYGQHPELISDAAKRLGRLKDVLSRLQRLRSSAKIARGSPERIKHLSQRIKAVRDCIEDRTDSIIAARKLKQLERAAM